MEQKAVKKDSFQAWSWYYLSLYAATKMNEPKPFCVVLSPSPCWEFRFLIFEISQANFVIIDKQVKESAASALADKVLRIEK